MVGRVLERVHFVLVGVWKSGEAMRRLMRNSNGVLWGLIEFVPPVDSV